MLDRVFDFLVYVDDFALLPSSRQLSLPDGRRVFLVVPVERAQLDPMSVQVFLRIAGHVDGLWRLAGRLLDRRLSFLLQYGHWFDWPFRVRIGLEHTARFEALFDAIGERVLHSRQLGSLPQKVWQVHTSALRDARVQLAAG